MLRELLPQANKVSQQGHQQQPALRVMLPLHPAFRMLHRFLPGPTLDRNATSQGIWRNLIAVELN